MNKTFYCGLIFITIATLPVYPDGASYHGEGRTVWPIRNDQVEMTEERVIIRYDPQRDWFEADCQYVLHNTGEATNVLMGFPDEDDFNPPGITDIGPTVLGFRAWVDGRKVPIQVKTGLPSPVYPDLKHKRVLTWQTKFNSGQTRTVRNCYHFKGIYYAEKCRLIRYILRTGKVWKGPIGTAEIIVHGLPKDCLMGISPPGYRIDADQCTWTLKAFEPDSDIEILANEHVLQWFNASLQMLKRKAIKPKTLFQHLEIIETYRQEMIRDTEGGVWIRPECFAHEPNELETLLLSRMPEGPMKDKVLYRFALTKGDTNGAATRFITSLGGWRKGLILWDINEALNVPEQFKNPNDTTYGPWLRKAYPDTGRYVRSLKAVEDYFKAAWDTSTYFQEWPRLGGSYLSVCNTTGAMRCFQRELDRTKQMAKVDTNRLASVLEAMGTTMLVAGDTAKGITYLEQAASHPHAIGGTEARHYLDWLHTTKGYKK